MICLTLTGTTMNENLNSIEENRKFIDIVELRMDLLYPGELDNLRGIYSKLGIKAIATFRRECDGGEYEGPENYRIEVLEKAVEAGFDYVDIEYDVDAPELERIAFEKGVRIIKSYHSFKGIPDNLEEIMRESSAGGKRVPKAAVTLTSSRDVLNFIRITQALLDMEEKIILGMGDYGFFSRVLYRKLGSFLTFCSVGKSGAPGQISPGKMYSEYNASLFTKKGKVYGIMGNPVMHTKSPLLHNGGFRELGMDCIYVPFTVDDITSFLGVVSILGIEGFSVTIPFKKDIIPFLTDFDPVVRQSGACNTVVVNGKSLRGWNTDVEGFLIPLKKRVDPDTIKKVAIIGAGGAASAILEALKTLNAEVHVFNRTTERSSALAREYGVSAHPLSEYGKIQNCDLIVQTTSVGMSPKADSSPVPGYEFKSNQIAYDIIYTPEETVFLSDARKKGCITINGMEMLKVQGEKQFELFTGRPYPKLNSNRSI